MKRVTIHIRTKNANHAYAKTLCGERIHDPRIDEFMGDKKLTDALWNTECPKGYLSIRHSVHEKSADRLDVKGFRNWELPRIDPHCPPVRYWDFCPGCWDNPIRSLKHLAKEDL